MNIDNLHNFWKNIYSTVDWGAHENCRHTCKSGNCCTNCLSLQYFGKAKVDYSCEQLRKIYVLRYLHVHYAEVQDALQLVSALEDFPSLNRKLNIISLGGGPGSDILAFKNFVITHPSFLASNSKSEITRVDRETSWDSLSRHVLSLSTPEVNSFFDHRKILTSIEDLMIESKYDVFLISYLISELNRNGIENLGRFIVDHAKKNAIVIINDRNETSVQANIAYIKTLLNIKNEAASNVHRFCGIYYLSDLIDRVEPKRYMSSLRMGLILE